MTTSYKIYRQKVSRYPIVVYSTSCDSPMNHLPELENDLKEMGVKGEVLFDLLLSNGNTSDRFYKAVFNGFEFSSRPGRMEFRTQRPGGGTFYGHASLEDMLGQLFGTRTGGDRKFTGMPFEARYSFICLIVNVPKCAIDATRTASACPSVMASYRCSSVPAPPEAITGIFTASAIARVIGMS